MFKRDRKISQKIVCALTAFFLVPSFILSPVLAWAQPVNGLLLPAVGEQVHLTKPFTPLLLNGITLDDQNPLKFNFLISLGQETNLTQAQIAVEANQQIKYFLAALTVPEKELWVNLSPYEQDRIIPEDFGKTEMGRDLLGQDYILKQLSASLMYPDSELGNRFWKRVYEKAQQKYGHTNIPTSTFNKIWIVPDQAQVYQHNRNAFVLKCHLKVMLAQDYVAMMHMQNMAQTSKSEAAEAQAKEVNEVTSAVLREVLIPEIEKEVNEGKTFVQLRQVFNALVLATWFKKNLRDSLVSQIYVDQNKVKGIVASDVQTSQTIYNQYLAAIKQGVYNYIKEENDPVTDDLIPRKYFAGGVMGQIPDGVLTVVNEARLPDGASSANVMVETNLLGVNAASSASVTQTFQSGQPVVAASTLETLEEMVISLQALAEEGLPVFIPDLAKTEVPISRLKMYLPVYVDAVKRRDIIGMKTSLNTIRKENIFPQQWAQIDPILELLSNPSAQLASLSVAGQGVVKKMSARLAELASQGQEVFVPALTRGKPSPHLGALLISYVHAVETKKPLQELLALKELLDYSMFSKQKAPILALLDIRRYRFHDIPIGLKTDATQKTLGELSAAITAGDQRRVIDRLEHLAGQLHRMGDVAYVTRERIIYEDLELVRQYHDHRTIEAALNPQTDWRKYFDDAEGKRILSEHPQVALQMRNLVLALQAFEKWAIQVESPPGKDEFQAILNHLADMETTEDFGSFQDNPKVRLQVQRYLQDHWLAERQSWRRAYLRAVKEDLIRKGGFREEDYLGLPLIKAKMRMLGFDQNTIEILGVMQKIQKDGYPVTVPAIAAQMQVLGSALVNEHLHTHIQPILSGGIFNVDVLDAAVVAQEQEDWFGYLMDPNTLRGIIQDEGIATLEALVNYLDSTVKAGKSAIRARLSQVEFDVAGKSVKLSTANNFNRLLASMHGQANLAKKEILKTSQGYEIYYLPHSSYTKLSDKVLEEDAQRIKSGISQMLDRMETETVKDYARIREIRNIQHKIYYVKFFPNEKKAVVLVFAPFSDLVGGSSSYALDVRVSQYYNGFAKKDQSADISALQPVMVKAASTPLAQKDNLGGINLDPALLDLQIKRDEKGVLLPLAQQPLFSQPIEGFIPVIINITPVPNLSQVFNQ